MCHENTRPAEYLQITWANIQHNENIRNRLFQFYLIITAGFLVFYRGDQGVTISGQTGFLASVLIWAMGVSFLWAYERIREMINRDNRIVSHIKCYPGRRQ